VKLLGNTKKWTSLERHIKGIMGQKSCEKKKGNGGLWTRTNLERGGRNISSNNALPYRKTTATKKLKARRSPDVIGRRGEGEEFRQLLVPKSSFNTTRRVSRGTRAQKTVDWEKLHKHSHQRSESERGKRGFSEKRTLRERADFDKNQINGLKLRQKCSREEGGGASST